MVDNNEEKTNKTKEENIVDINTPNSRYLTGGLEHRRKRCKSRKNDKEDLNFL